MSYTLQTKDSARAAWRAVRFVPAFASESAAWDHAAGLDQDRYISPTLRVVDENGKAVSRPDPWAFQ